MLDISVVCPACGTTILVPKETFESTFSEHEHDAQEMKAQAICACGLFGFNVSITLEPFLDEDGEADGLTIGNVKVETIVTAN